MVLFLELDNEDTAGFQGAMTLQALLRLPKECSDFQEYLVFPKHGLSKGKRSQSLRRSQVGKYKRTSRCCFG